MYGRSWSRLLAILFVVFPLAVALGQSAHLNPWSDSAKAELPPPEVNRPASQPIVELPNLTQPIALPHRIPVPRHPTGFPQIVRDAGIIFSGTVITITRSPAIRGPAIDSVSITFHVEHAIRGTAPGENLKVSQWMGAWSSGQRYRVGERVLLFLYPRSKLGLTSVVGGGLGRFAIDAQGRVLLNVQHRSAFREDALLGEKSLVRFIDLALAVRRASEEESAR
jgi:hypothetical protein